jgi:DeoR family transcriptional regulator, fructose operon transcriptional repressor
MTQLLRNRSYLPVMELCRKFKISEATARRDLAALSEDKTIVRTFGGAMADYDHRFAPFADRLKIAAKAKAKIAGDAIALISPGMTVFMDAGTTLYAVADRLRARPIDLHVVTNNLAVAERLAGIKKIAVDLLGGRMLPNQSVLLGERACRACAFYSFDLALLGAEGFDEQGIWNTTDEIVALQRAVINQSKRHAVCADSRKMGRSAPVQVMGWNEVDVLLTDASDVQIRALSHELSG